MKLEDYNIAEHLPESLDRTNLHEVAEVADEKLHELDLLAEVCGIYPRIDELSSNLIDALASQLHVDFYDRQLPLDVRRTLVKNSIPWHMKKGTPAAVKAVLSTVFGETELREWYNYGGAPYHFQVITERKHINKAELEAMHRAIDATKSLRSWLDTVVLKVGDPFYLNRGSRPISWTVRGKERTTEKHTTTYDGVLNACGGTETVTTRTTRHIPHTAWTYSGRLINGRLNTNGHSTRNTTQSEREVITTRQRSLFDFPRMSTNCSGRVRRSRRDIGCDVTLTQRIFTGGTSNGGRVKASMSTETVIRESWRDVFKPERGLTNSRASPQINKAEAEHIKGETSSEEKTTTAYTFAGPLTNGRLQSNSAASYDVMRTVHIARWREVVTRTGGDILNEVKHHTLTEIERSTQHIEHYSEQTDAGLNGAHASRKDWITTETSEKHSVRFANPPFRLNETNSHTNWKDIGEDIELEQVLFTANTLNDAEHRDETEKITKKLSQTWRKFEPGETLNGLQQIILNRASLLSGTTTSTESSTRTARLFTGAILGGKLKTNAGTPERVTRTVHIPKWRNVTVYEAERLLNSTKRYEHIETVSHKDPDKVYTKFSPKRGTLLNNHAVLGYLRL